MSRQPSTRRTRRRFLEEADDPRFRALSRPYELWHEFYTSMLLRDLEHVFPYPDFHRDFTARLEVNSGAVDDNLVAAALARERWHRRHELLAESVRDFGEECAPQMVAFGEAAYELAFASPGDTGKWQEFRLHLIHPYRSRFGRHQFYALSENGSRGRWINLPANSVVRVRLSRRRRRQVADVVAALTAANAHNPVRARLQFTPGLPYAFTHHAAAEREILARATRPIGWRGRGLFTDEQLEPYRLLRDLRFEGFQAELRDVILRGINEALARAGAELGFSARVTVEGVPGIDEVNRQVARVLEGVGPELSLQDVLKPFI